MNTFSVGQVVTWESQANSYKRRKTGVIVAVVPPDVLPVCCVPPPENHPGGGWRFDACSTLPRTQESYLVHVEAHPGHSKRSNRTLYWPRVSALELVPALQAPVCATPGSQP